MTNIVILAVIVLLGINLSVGNVTEEDGAQVIFRLTGKFCDVNKQSVLLKFFTPSFTSS